MKFQIFIFIFLFFDLISCRQSSIKNPSLLKITYRLETDNTGGAIYLLSFKNFTLNHDFFKLNDSDVVKIKFLHPPQSNLMNKVYFMPIKIGNTTVFEFMDSNFLGLDSLKIKEFFTKEILNNRIDILLNDSIVQSIIIKKEPIFEYLVGPEKKLNIINRY